MDGEEINHFVDRCKSIFLTQKEHGEYMTKVEARFGEIEGEIKDVKGDVKNFIQGQRTNRNLLVLVAAAVIGDVFLTLLKFFK